MSFLFRKSTDAIKNAMETRSYGVYFSECAETDSEIHCHNCCEVLLCLSGFHTLLIDGKIYEIKNGDVVFLNEFEHHKAISPNDDSFARFGLMLHPQFIKKSSTKTTDLSLCFYNAEKKIICLTDDEMAKTQKYFISFRNSNSYGDDILKDSAVKTILVLLNDLYQNGKKTAHNNYRANDTLVNALSYINQNYHMDISLNTIAQNLPISVNQLCKIFKTNLNTTVSKYITAKRISSAKKLLAECENVSKTAVLCGFNDYANFIRTFKKITGVSPGKFSKL